MLPQLPVQPRHPVTLTVCVALGFTLSPRKSRCDIPPSRTAAPVLNPLDRQTQLDAYASREYTVEIYVPNGKEGSQYFKVKLSDLDSMGGQDDRSSFPTVTAKSCFGIPPDDVFVVQTQ